MEANAIAFYGFGSLTLIGSFLVITRRQPVAAVLWLVVAVLGLAGLFFSLNAEFLGVLQIFLYGDAITVIFIFIIMAMNIPEEKLPEESLTVQSFFGLAVSGLILLFLFDAITGHLPASSGSLPEGFGSISAFAGALFERHFLAFEALSVLLLVAIIGVTVLSRKEIQE